jgi:ABC-type nickel/cobalt efflux system permease component RcnA
VTLGLTVYPEDLLRSAPAVTSASFRFRAGETSAPAQPATTPTGRVAREDAEKTLGRFASLVATEKLTPAVIAVALVLSAAWGAMHALGPGHGKTVVAAYLVGERGTSRHAIYLGLIVTATHTISVFALGAVAIFASDVVAADDIYFWLSLGSGLLVAALGGVLLWGRVRRLVTSARIGRTRERTRHYHTHEGHDHGEHDHGHEHGEHDHAHGDHSEHEHGPDAHDHGHSHVPARPGWRGIVALGVAGGIVPCPTALVVMLGAIALERAVFGLAMVTAFSAGLAGVLTGVGLLMVHGRRWLEGRRLPFAGSGLLRRAQLVAPVMSAVTIMGVGLVLASQAVL